MRIKCLCLFGTSFTTYTLCSSSFVLFIIICQGVLHSLTYFNITRDANKHSALQALFYRTENELCKAEEGY